MTTIRRSRKSTVARYLTVAPQHTEFPTQPASYLAGPITVGQRAMLLCRADALLPRTGPAGGPCPQCGDARPLTVQHALMDCGVWAPSRDAMWHAIADVAGAAEVQRVRALPPAAQVAALLGTAGWGGAAGLVNSQVQRFLASVYTSLREPRSTARAALGSIADVACQLCHSRGREASLLLCDGCGRGYHARCLTPALAAVPAGAWLCPTCDPPRQPLVQHISRRPRREGPWPSG